MRPLSVHDPAGSQYSSVLCQVTLEKEGETYDSFLVPYDKGFGRAVPDSVNMHFLVPPVCNRAQQRETLHAMTGLVPTSV